MLNRGRNIEKGRVITRRMFILAAAKILLFAGISSRLYNLQISDREKYEILSDKNRIREWKTPPQRGIIVDNFNKVLASNDRVFQLHLILDEINDFDVTIFKIKNLIGLDQFQIKKLYKKKERLKPWDTLVVSDNLTWEQFSKINLYLHELEGAKPVLSTSRFYPYANDLVHIVGYVGDASPKDLEKPEIKENFVPGLKVGKYGIENSQEKMLIGNYGIKRYEVNASGKRISQIDYIKERQGSGGFKEIDDVSIAAPLTKYSASITDGTRIREFVDKAYRIATNGYPGAVHLSLPVDIMFSSFEENVGLEERPFSHKAKPVAKAWPDPNALSKILELACNAKKPVIIGGHGVWWSNSEKNLETAGESLNIPVFNVPYHQKLLGEEANAYMGLADIHQYPPSEFALYNSDLVLMIGARLDNQMNFGNPPFIPKTTTLVCINGSHEEIEFNRAADHNLLCDPGVFLDTLCNLKKNNKWNLGNSWFQDNKNKKKDWVDKSLNELKIEADKAKKMEEKFIRYN